MALKVIDGGKSIWVLVKNKYGSESFGIMSMAPFPSKKTILTKPLPLFVIFHPNNRFLPRLSSFVGSVMSISSVVSPVVNRLVSIITRHC